MADIAHVLHFSAAELWEMDDEELKAWHDQAVRIMETLAKARQ